MARRRNLQCLRQPVSARLNLEQFEQRVVPASFVVKTTADSGPDSLRAAIGFANVSGATTITFDFPPGGPLLFTPTSPLPAMLTKASFVIPFPSDESKRVEINGALAGPGATGLVFMAGGYMADISVTGWSSFGVSLLGGSTTVTDSYIGTNHGGTVDKGNIGGGINIASSGNTVFLTTISGNESVGITLKGPAAGGNTIFGNLIGVAGDGKTPMENKGDGIYCEEAPGNLLGGSIGFGNTVSGNTGSGIHIKGAGAMDNKIVGNKIGLGGDNSAVPNALGGVFIEGAPSTSIGGADPSDKNFISANSLHGVGIIGATAKGNFLRGNFIGVGLDETSDRGNKGNGVFIGGGASENFIGKPLAGHTNTIAFNGSSLGTMGLKGHGVEIAAGSKNTISRNSIYKNFGRGIDLNGDWVTINDAKGDADGGANDSQDYPVVIRRPDTGIANGGVHTWKLNSTPGKSFTVEIFESPSLDPAEYGEGKTYLSSITTAVTDANGDATFTFDHTGHLFVTMTATDFMGNTSEFSMIDSDADGLADAWEIADGLDIDEDGVLFANELILAGSNANQKDLFVEVDAMTGFAPGAGIFDPGTPVTAGGVIKAFGLATNLNIHNPDQADGINLHVVYDEKNINPEAFAKIDDPFPRFQEIKNGTAGNGLDGRFGTVAQRADVVNWVQIRQALSLTHRYSMFADQYKFYQRDNANNIELDAKNNPIVINSSSGLGELHGNDFMVTFGAAGWSKAPFVLTDIDRAGTWMHELGHTLGLNHGGAIGDGTNYKPNYHSVMNYYWQYPGAFLRTGVAAADYTNSWRLDYSGETLTQLNESMLVEGSGISAATTAFTVPFGGQVGGYFLAKADGNSVNWNNSGGIQAGTIQVDINFNGSNTDIFNGHNDWFNLRYNFLEQASFAPGYFEVPDGDTLPPPTFYPHVASVKINDGSAQRSRVTSLTVTFDQHIDITFSLADAFVVTRQGDGKQPTLVTSVDDAGATTVVTLTFLGTNAVDYGSLADGRYTLTVLDSNVTNGFGMLDGDSDGQPGGNYVLASAGAPNPPTNIFRFFGDSDGDGNVAANDFIQFRLALGGSNPTFDFDGDGAVAASDFIQFRLRFGGSI